MKLVAESLNESLGYKTIFGNNVSHEEALQKNIRDLVSNIIMEERGISEKSFSSIDNVMEEVRNFFDDNPELYEKTQQFYEQKRRIKYLAEEIYQKYFNQKEDLKKI